MINVLKNNEIVNQIIVNLIQIFKIIVRLLRKRIVLALIFTLSFTYCLLSLIRERNHVKSINGNLYDYETNVDIDQFNININNNINNINNKLKNETIIIDNNDKQLNNDKIVTDVNKCRNSIQGKVLIADDRGFVCHRKDVLLTGCCDQLNVNTKLYSCDTCQSHGCCAIYEFCISCCLEPSKKPLLTKIVGAKTSETFSLLMASISDHFELCLTKCRTNSKSVINENSYRDPKLKHCFGDTFNQIQ